MTEFMRKAIFYLILFLMPLLVLEITLQVFYRIKNGRFLYERMVIPIYDVDNDRYYKLKPNLTYAHKTNEYNVVYYTNSQGFRTDYKKESYNLKKIENIYRVFFLGPSFTFGWGNNYKDIYPTIISNMINVQGKRVEAINIGTPAQPVTHQLRWLKRTGYKFGPDMIIQTVYGTPHDIQSRVIEPSHRVTVKDGYLYVHIPNARLRLISIARNSGIVFYGWYFYQGFISKPSSNIGLGTELYENASKGDSIAITRYEECAKIYVEYKNFVRESLGKDIPIVFLYIPYSSVVRPTDVSRWQHLGYQNPFEIRKEAKEIKEILKRYNIIFIDTTDVLEAKDKNKRMYYYLDIHLTPEGNRVVAEESVSVIQKLLQETCQK